jgi:predicted ATPase/transcriptional regulator with GAF, ATPase, and Fis domain/tRNA A-37 threonylcarbamoyl transferase component Bud32
MIGIPAYQVGEKLYESPSTLVYRARREADGAPVILKVLKPTSPNHEEAIRYKQEYEIIRSLNLACVPKALALERHEGTSVIVLEDIGAVSLDKWIAEGDLTLDELLSVAISTARGLGEIHEADVIHKDINPSNIVFNPQSGRLQIIDFAIATVLPHENPLIRNPEVLEGTLAYISPEQTGRMNRSIDYRTDFYSLGITFYELFTGGLPFETTDPVELVHAHMARSPVPPYMVRENIPPLVSDIVMKLTSKTPEGRYQSARGIKADLEKCLSQLRSSGSVLPFELGREDVSGKLRISEKLYGRDREIEALLKAFERVCVGPMVMSLISGPAGIGKTALVRELHRPITERRGTFISGKFDPLRSNMPYSAVITAFSDLVRQLLVEGEPRIVYWRKKLLQALKPNGQVMIDVIPEVALITGPQPPVPALPPAAARNRFELVFQKFVGAFIEPDRPLVLFLDDLHWADSASLKLVKLMAAAPEMGHFFLIGAYRSNEVDEAHPLTRAMQEWRAAGADLVSIDLSPLDGLETNHLLADTLGCSPQESSGLAEQVMARTNGNPFFVKEFVKSLYGSRLLVFDPGQLKWRWSIPDIQGSAIGDSVGDLVAQNIRDLDVSIQTVLYLAACIGNDFDLKTLSLICGMFPRETALLLREAVSKGLVFPVGDGYRPLDLDESAMTIDRQVPYRFAHDRIQQVAYEMLPENARLSSHWRIGQVLLQNTPPEEREERIFDIVNQLNAGKPPLSDETERRELAGLNLAAGRRAKAATAFELAFFYLRKGIDLIHPEGESVKNDEVQSHAPWRADYPLTLSLYNEAAEAAYLCAEYSEMEALAGTVLREARTTLDKVRAYEARIRALYARNKMLEAVQMAFLVLKMLDVRFPDSPGRVHAISGFARVKMTLAGRRIEDLEDLPEMTDPHKLAAMRIMAIAVPASFYAAPNLFPLIVFKGVRFSVRYGNTAESVFAYAGYGLILCGVLGDVEAGYRFGQLAQRLIEKLGARPLLAKTLVTIATFILHWKEHIRETLPMLLDAYQQGLETGDLEFAALGAHVYSCFLFYGGCPLGEVEGEIALYAEKIRGLKQETPLTYQRIIQQTVLNLTGEEEDACRLCGRHYNESKMLPRHLAANDQNALFTVYLQKLMLCYLFGDLAQAVENGAEAARYVDAAAGSPDVPLYYFYRALVQTAVFPGNSKADRKRILNQLSASQKKLKKWSDLAPMNYLNKYHLVEAERLRILGRGGEAGAVYGKAADEARKNHYINEEGLAHELSAKFQLSEGRADQARQEMERARQCYLTWGAVAKVRDLQSHHPELLAEGRPESRLTSEHVGLPSKSTITSSGEALDSISIVKTIHAISGEIHMDRLLERLMAAVMENAGAQYGFLILKSDAGLVIKAEMSVEPERAILLQNRPAETSKDVPVSVLNYVNRTREPLVIDDITHDDRFAQDPAVKASCPKSVACMPLILKSDFKGMLYLENDLSSGAFNSRRVEALQVLSSQIAISLENARLYTDLQNQAEKLKEINHTLTQEIAARIRAEEELRNHKDHLEEVVKQRTAQLQETRRALINLRGDLKKRDRFQNIVGQSERMQEIYSMLEELADQSATVLITGESGTGKELIAEALHFGSIRRTRPFVKVNCAALAETVLESELFGHARGAFTGAVRRKAGRFEKAEDGTVLLDEIGEVSNYFQKRLLRVLQEREFEPVGDATPIKMNARIVATTNRDLAGKVKRGEFRVDLYHRLRVVELNVPPLRDRTDDIPVLVRHFLNQFNEELNKQITDVSQDVLDRFVGYDWPGNVRELKNILHHACIMCKDDVIQIGNLPRDFARPSAKKPSSVVVESPPGEREGLLQALEKAKWNKTQAARLLGISRRTLYRKLQQYDLMQD